MKWILVTACVLASQVLADWSVKNGKLSVVRAGTTINTQSFDEVKTVELSSNTALELSFETHNSKSGARAHQTMATLVDESSDLQFSFTPSLNVKPNGKAKIVIAHKSIPVALQAADKLTLSLLVGSFDAEKPAKVQISKNVVVDSTNPKPQPARLGVKPEIVHQYKPDPKRVPAPVALFFAAGSGVLLVGVLGFLFTFGSVSAAPTAFKQSPLGHFGLLGSIIALETVFVMYYLGQSIFSTLSAVGVVAPVALFTGSRALREIKQRREKTQK